MSRTKNQELPVAEKLRRELPLTPDEVEYLEHKPTLTADEAAWRLGVTRRYLLKELHGKGVLPPDRTPPGSNRYAWSKEAIDQALKDWGHAWALLSSQRHDGPRDRPATNSL